jgi:serine/tyrosine/threonine adenylyltransferase
MPVTTAYRAAPRIHELGDGFYDVVEAASFPERRLRFRNDRWAARVGLDALDAAEWERHFAAFAPLPDNLPQPLALRYHGHQFRVFNPNIGDGRGFLHAQLLDDADRLLDLATKGSGRTPWSRDGDGRLTLKGGVREVLATEMLEALGVPTSKTFSLFETGEQLWRGDEPSPTRSSVLVRLGHSHVRFGSFQRQLALGDQERVRRLLDYAIRHYAADLVAGEGEDTASAFLRVVTERSARLGAAWMTAGFVHGVLNTDNMNVTGESFDYGPFRFLPVYDPAFTAAYFDHAGLYAYERQPTSVHWNLQRLADTLIESSSADALSRALDLFLPEFLRAWREGLLRRLGLAPLGDERDEDFLSICRAFLVESKVGYDRFFFDWYGGAASEARAAASPEADKYRGATFLPLRAALDAYTPVAPERLSDPYFQRAEPCSLLIDEIEALWSAIAERDDWAPFEAKVADIRAMGASTGLAATL